MEMKPNANREAELIRSFEPYRLKVQISTTMVAGIVMTSVGKENASEENGFIPLGALLQAKGNGNGNGHGLPAFAKDAKDGAPLPKKVDKGYLKSPPWIWKLAAFKNCRLPHLYPCTVN